MPSRFTGASESETPHWPLFLRERERGSAFVGFESNVQGVCGHMTPCFGSFHPILFRFLFVLSFIQKIHIYIYSTYDIRFSLNSAKKIYKINLTKSSLGALRLESLSGDLKAKMWSDPKGYD